MVFVVGLSTPGGRRLPHENLRRTVRLSARGIEVQRWDHSPITSTRACAPHRKRIVRQRGAGGVARAARGRSERPAAAPSCRRRVGARGGRRRGRLRLDVVVAVMVVVVVVVVGVLGVPNGVRVVRGRGLKKLEVARDLGRCVQGVARAWVSGQLGERERGNGSVDGGT